MKEILCRAQRKDNGEWVEGFYSQLPKPSLGATIITNGDLCAEDVSDYIIVNECKQHSNFSNAFPIEVVECEYYEIDPETLCQYTGLKDKNGNRIWENDVLILYGGEYRAVVVWNPACGRWDVSCIVGSYMRIPMGKWKPIVVDRTTKDWEEYTESYDFVVIGNIFDNPELMKGE